MRGDSWGSVYLSANFSSALYNRDQDTTLLLSYFYKYFTSGSPYRKCTRKSIRQYEAMSLLKKSKVLLPDYLKINLYSLKCCTHWISAFKKKLSLYHSWSGRNGICQAVVHIRIQYSTSDTYRCILFFFRQRFSLF